MSLRTRQTAIIGTVVSMLIVGGCSAQSAPASDGSPDRAQPASPQAGSAPPAPSQASGPYEGFLEKMSCDLLRGWAWDPSQPERVLSIDLYDGDRLLKTAVADQFRQDLLDARKGNGRHLFIDAPPPELKDGKAHSIRAVVKGTSYALRPLADTPASITCPR